MNENRAFLLDDWSVTGTDGDKKRLYEVLEHLTKSTFLMKGKTDGIQFFTYKEDPSPDDLGGQLHGKKGSSAIKISLQKMKTLFGAGNELLKEMKEDVRLLLFLENRVFFTTQKVFKTLSQRAGSACGDFVACKDYSVRFHRDAGYAAYMKVMPADCKILYRQQEGAKKVFAVFANSYQLLPQYPIIKRIIEGLEKEMGVSNLIYYRVDNFNTQIFIDYPEKAKDFANVYALPETVTPGIHIRLSDVGESSVIINGTVRFKGNCLYIPSAEYKREHTKNATLNEIFKGVETKIFAEYTKVPEQMLKLLGINLADPAACLEKVMRYTGVGKIVGKRAEKQMLMDLTSQINSTIPYTAYDIAGMFLEMSEELCKNRGIDSADKVRTALTRALWYNY